MINLHHTDCMTFMAGLPDKAFDLDLCELDKDYFEAGKKRLEAHQAAPRLFEAQKETFTQLSIEP
jgi:hypothetical protein